MNLVSKPRLAIPTYSLEVQGKIGMAVNHYQTFLPITEGRKVYQPARKKVLDRIIRLENT